MADAAIPLLNMVILGSFMLFSLAQVRRMQQLTPARQRSETQRDRSR